MCVCAWHTVGVVVAGFEGFDDGTGVDMVEAMQRRLRCAMTFLASTGALM